MATASVYKCPERVELLGEFVRFNKQMDIETLIAGANEQGASDLHLEPGLPPAVRVRGVLRASGEPVPAKALMTFAQSLIGQAEWPRFVERRSFDFSRRIQGVRCRINVLQTARGVGFAIRI